VTSVAKEMAPDRHNLYNDLALVLAVPLLDSLSRLWHTRANRETNDCEPGK
jgi:hypothetical protein